MLDDEGIRAEGEMAAVLFAGAYRNDEPRIGLDDRRDFARA